jgi:hypothetical protein
MAWHVSKTCRNASVAFGPDRTVKAAGILSLVTALALLALVAAGGWRPARGRGEARGVAGGRDSSVAVGDPPEVAGGRPPAARGAEPPVAGNGDAVARFGAMRAALVAVPLSLAFGFLFAARATPLFALGLFVILWRAIPTRHLLLTAGALLVIAVPVLTLVIPVDDRGGYDPDYAGERVAVHWVAAAAVALLIVALARLLMARRRAARSPA